MKDGSRQRVKLQFRQYSINPDFPIFAFQGDKKPYNPQNALNDGADIRYMHFHNCIEIGYCHSGRGQLFMNDGAIEYGAGDVMLVLPYCAHITHPSGIGESCDFLYFDPSALLRKFYPDGLPCMTLFESSSDSGSSVLRGAEHPIIARRIVEILDELNCQRMNYQDCVKGLVLALMMELARVLSEQPARERLDRSIVSIFPAIKYINDNYAEHISTDTLHDQCYLSGTHFRRLFSSLMGCSPLEYIHRLRINRACDLLLSTNESILNISLAVGFDSVSSFNRQFIQATSMSPSKWRRERVQSHLERIPTAPYDTSRQD